jgi:hypothetical protein
MPQAFPTMAARASSRARSAISFHPNSTRNVEEPLDIDDAGPREAAGATITSRQLQTMGGMGK